MALYPVFLKLEGRKVLVVGGGAVAEQKLEGVLRSATDVTVIAPAVTSRIREWANQRLLKHAELQFQPGLAQGYFLVIAATDSVELNHAVYAEASADGALCNAVDDMPYCDFYAPAVVNRGDFQIAVSTGGNSPALAQRVRKELEAEFGPEYAAWNGWLGRLRSALRSILPPGERRKELLHLLALTQPQKSFTQSQTRRNSWITRDAMNWK
jgi:precorrin-2 dehydrogenase / sirohydrochlorin ferrochelatase